MAPVIRVDDEVWQWLKKHAQPLEDTPNTVLRRLAGLSAESNRPRGSGPLASPLRAPDSSEPRESSRLAVRGPRTNDGRHLNEVWKVGARHALYHKDGDYYNHLRYFPGALFDPAGYVVFKTEQDYLKSPHLQRGTQLHVPRGIASLPGYVRVR